MPAKAAWAALALAAALAGCSRNEQAPAAAAAPASAALPDGEAPLKVAFVYVGPVGDGGWTYAHDEARKAVEREFKGAVVTSYAENVREGADMERTLREIGGQGTKLIFGTTFGYMDQMLKVSGEFKDVRFEHATGFKHSDNMRTYDARSYEGAYMAGVIAGGMTKTNVLGVVASVPIPEVIRNLNSFTLGALSVNPNVKTKVAWVNEWVNPPLETRSAQILIDSGADVLLQNTDSSAVLQTAEKNGKYAFGWDSDMTAYAPKAHLASSIVNWSPYYIRTTREVLQNRWKPDQHTWWGVKEGAIDLVSVSDKVPAELKARVDTVRAGLKDGSFAVWKGPILSNDGKEMLKAGQVADDKFLSGIMFYVKGVEGKVPSSDKP
jgi:simple sugar transport system substrate-binding protein